MNKELHQRMRAVDDGADIRQMSLRVVDYARVSTASIEQKKSLQNQLDTYRGMIEENPNWTYAGTYSDEAISGTKAYLRGGFQQMIADAKRGVFDLIVVKDVARFARNLKECLVYKDLLKSYGVMIWFVKDNINTFCSKDETMLQIMGVGAEMEAKSARERTRIVFQQGIRKGCVYGNSKILGYQKEHCSLVIDEYEAEIVRLIFELYVHERLGLRRIAKELTKRNLTRRDGTKIPTRTIKSVLENPKYKGYFCGGKTVKVDAGDRYIRRELPQEDWVMYKDPDIPAIVSESLWDAAARIRQERQREFQEAVSAPCNQGIYTYSGKIESGFVPGVNYTRVNYRYNGAEREGWQCRNHKDPAHPGNVGPTLYTDELDEILSAVLQNLLGGYDSVVASLMERYRSVSEDAASTDRLTALEQEKEKISGKQKKLLELYEDDAISKADFIARNKEHQARLAVIEAQAEGLRNSAGATRKMLSDLDNLWETVKAAAKEVKPSKETVNAVVDKIIVKNTSTKTRIDLEIHFKVLPQIQNYTIRRDRKKPDDVSCKLCNQCTSMSPSSVWRN